MNTHSMLRQATFFALFAALISGANNFLTKIAVTAVKDPILFTTLKNTLVAVGITGIIILTAKHKEIFSLSRQHLLKLAAIGAIGGSLPFALYFSGLAQTTAINASLIHKTLFLWVMLLALPLLKERMTRIQLIGVGLVFIANMMVGGFGGFKFNPGEFMILAATILWAIENIIAKIALRDISSIVVAGARMMIGSFLLLGIVLWRGGSSAVFSLSLEQWSWTALTSVLLLGFVLAWYKALKLAPATYVAVLLVPATLVTNTLSALFITHALTVHQITSTLLFLSGTACVVFFAKNTTVTISENSLPVPATR